MSDSSTFWSSEQVEYLTAMGYSVLALQTDEVEAAVAPPAPAVAPAPPTVAVEPRHNRGNVPQPATNVPPPPSVPPEVAVARAAAVRATAPTSPLERALLSATGQSRRSEARAVLDELKIDFDALRNDPAAKRALWPRLRAIRAKRRA